MTEKKIELEDLIGCLVEDLEETNQYRYAVILNVTDKGELVGFWRSSVAQALHAPMEHYGESPLTLHYSVYRKLFLHRKVCP